MKNIPIASSDGSLTTQNTKIAHLFEIQLAELTLIDAAASSDTQLFVDKIEQCFVGQRLFYAYEFFTNIYKVGEIEVLTVNDTTNLITFSTDSALLGPLNKGATVVDGTFSYENMSAGNEIVSALGGDTLRLYVGAFGALTGKLMFTDCDVPILTDGDRSVFNNSDSSSKVDGKVVYVPYPITFNGVNSEITGKIGSVTVSFSNVDQLAGQIILNRDMLEDRSLVIKTAYLNTGTVYPIELYHTDVVNYNINHELSSENEPFGHYIHVDGDQVVYEFNGIIENCNFDNNKAGIIAIAKLDTEEGTIIPKRTYTRLRCPFKYKGNKCRFISNMKLLSSLASSDTGDIIIYSDQWKFYFRDLHENETYIIKIDNELIKIDGYSLSGLNDSVNYSPEQTRMISPEAKDKVFSSDGADAYKFKLSISERGYGGSTEDSHTADSLVDIPMCRKTEHDCRLHVNDLYYGAFPAIPKHRNNI